MWKMIDQIEGRITSAVQLGIIGCLVLVESIHSNETGVSSTITFVPGVALQPDSFGKFQLTPMAGYGQLPPTDLPPDPEDSAYS